MTADPFEVAVIQLGVRDGEPERNLETAAERLRDAPAAGLYLLPELWTTGYAHETWPGAADAHTPAAAGRLGQVARERKAWVGGSLITRTPSGTLANRFWLFGPDGEAAAQYDKAHLFPPLDEPTHLEPGSRRVRAPVGPFRAALSLCYDLRFPEMYRLDALDGADLFLVPAEWPAERVSTLHLLATARAAENQAYVVVCNRAGPARDGARFGGRSLIVAPDGSVLAQAGTGEETLRGRLDPARVMSVRASLPVFAQRTSGIDWQG